MNFATNNLWRALADFERFAVRSLHIGFCAFVDRIERLC